MNCDDCNYFVYDEDDDDWYCTVTRYARTASASSCQGIPHKGASRTAHEMDGDDYARLIQGHYRQCPYYRHEDEYQIVRHQM